MVQFVANQKIMSEYMNIKSVCCKPFSGKMQLNCIFSSVLKLLWKYFNCLLNWYSYIISLNISQYIRAKVKCVYTYIYSFFFKSIIILVF